MRFDGLYCPKCGERMRRRGKRLVCRCVISFMQEESKWIKWFLYGGCYH